MNEQVRSVLIGACIAMLGALVVYIPTTFIDNKEVLANFGPWAPFVAAVASVVVNVIRKLIEHLTAKQRNQGQ